MLKTLTFIVLCICTPVIHSQDYFPRRIHSKQIGHLHLTEQKWEIQHVMNLTEYIETTDILKECISTLHTACKNGSNPLCSYFQRVTENINAEIEADSSKLNTLSRQKRFIMTIPLIIGVTIVSLWAGFTMKKAAIQSIRDEIHGNLEMIEQAANITVSSLNLFEEYIKDNDRNMHNFQMAINNNTKNLDSLTRFFNVINVISFSAQMHEKMQIKLNDIYYGSIDSRLFEIIDFQEFSKTVDSINKMLEPNLKLPAITTMSKNKFIKTYTDYNTTHLIVSVDLPVINRMGFDMSEIIPLPMEENGKLFILDMPTTTYYKNGSRILSFPEEKVKNALCKTQDRLTICNSFLEDYNSNASNCIYNLLKNNSDVECTYREIPKRNYLIQLSDGILYLHLLYPIKIVIDCRGRVLAMTIPKSSKVYILADAKFTSTMTTLFTEVKEYLELNT